jgi:DNA segregation ATPase FtsK/SpoIIIE-like protein
MDMQGKVLEPLLMVLLQQARASGIHFLLLLQRPDGDVLPVRMRNNLNVRVSFRVSDPSASRLILNDTSACDLLGRGDGLYRDSDGVVTRFQAPLVTDKDITKTLQTAQTMPQPSYHVDGLMQSDVAMPSFDGLSRYDAAVVLSEGLLEMRSQDLVDAGIVDSQAVGKQVIARLEKHGILGAYDPSRKARPVIKQAGDSVNITGKKRVSDVNSGYDGYSERVMN